MVSCIRRDAEWIETTGAHPVCTSACQADGTVHIVVARLDQDSDTVRAAADMLSGDERQRARRFVSDRDRRRFVVARSRLRQLLAERLNMRPESVTFAYGAQGKPKLARAAGNPDLRFNLSHCRDIAVYAFGHGFEVGIDVEAVREIRDADDLAARYFSPGERDAYLALDMHDRPQGFFNCWTRKEAFVKASGEGLAAPLDGFEVSVAPDEPARLVRVGSTPGDRCGWEMSAFEPVAGYVAAVVTQNVASFRGRRVVIGGMP